MNRKQKRFMAKYLLNMNVFQKKQVLLKVIEKNSKYTKEEKSDLILKIDKMSSDEIDETIKGLVEFYVWVYEANARSINWVYTWYFRFIFNF